MRFREIIAKEAVTPIGTTTDPKPNGLPTTGNVPNPAQQKPGTTSIANTATNTAQQTPNPAQQKLAQTLAPYGFKSPADLNMATAAIQQAMKTSGAPTNLDDQSQETLVAMASQFLKNPSEADKVSTAIKALSQQQPGQTTPNT